VIMQPHRAPYFSPPPFTCTLAAFKGGRGRGTRARTKQGYDPENAEPRARVIFDPRRKGRWAQKDSNLRAAD